MADRSRLHHQLERNRGAIEERNNDDKSFIRMTYRYQIDLRYAYQVGERGFVGTTAGSARKAIYGLRELAEKAASHYPQGQPVTVYYDPEQPGRAVLEPDSRRGSLAPLIGAAICAVFGGLFLMFLIKVGFGN